MTTTTIVKPWGYENIVTVQPEYIVKELHIHEGHELSIQYHEHKRETMYVLSGVVNIFVNERSYLSLEYGSAITIHPMEVHTVVALRDSIILETSTPHMDDVVRLWDRYNRTESIRDGD